jgi:hypothetical protein
MPLDLDDQKAIDYSGSTNLLPFDAYGDFDLAILAFTESGPPGTEDNPGDKEYDLATATVLKSTCEKITQGEEMGLFFQTGGNGMTVKNRPFKAAAERGFLAACFGENAKDPAFKGKDARAKALASDYEDGNAVHVRLYRRKGNPMLDDKKQPVLDEITGEPRYWNEDKYISIP